MNNTQEKTKSKKQTIIIITLALVLVGCLVTAAVLLLNKPKEEPLNEPAKGVVGVIKDNWDTQVSSEPTDSPSQAKKGTQIPGYSSAEMNAGDMSIKLRIGNPKENHVGFYASLKLADGTVLYKSPLLSPGQGLEEVPLTQTLTKGTYDAIVEYKCVLLEDGKTPLNSAESGLKIYVN
ncbi:MAG: hypothetical protein II059_03470 [Clostridia bacterium]|nr:hypothetical protein [Clostridia bacterium]